MDKLRHASEAALFACAFLLFRALPLDLASALGGWIGKTLGPRLSRLHHVAQVNVGIAFPEKSPEEKARILRGMWENIGRVAAEFAHLPGNALYARVSCEGTYHLPRRGQAVQFISGHYGNWELTYPVAHQHGIPVTLVYRHANNPWIERMIASQRASQAASMLPKGPRGAMKLARAIRSRMSLALLVDQKMNEGIAVPFFGRPAMTAPAVAQFAMRFGMPIIPARVVRTQGCHFRATIYPPLSLPNTGDAEADTRAILTAINAMLEQWIREHPEQWFWVHRRWEKELYR